MTKHELARQLRECQAEKGMVPPELLAKIDDNRASEAYVTCAERSRKAPEGTALDLSMRNATSVSSWLPAWSITISDLPHVTGRSCHGETCPPSRGTGGGPDVEHHDGRHSSISSPTAANHSFLSSHRDDVPRMRGPGSAPIGAFATRSSGCRNRNCPDPTGVRRHVPARSAVGP